MLFSNDIYLSTTANNWIVSLNEVKTQLKFNSNTLEPSVSSFLVNAISTVSDTIDNYCGHGIKVQDYVGYYDGNYSNKLYTDNFPIQSISSLTYRLTPIDSYTNNVVSDITQFVFNYNNYIELYNNFFYCGRKSIKIIYTAGYTNIPRDIRQVALEQIQMIYDTSKFGNNYLGKKSQNNSLNVSQSETFDYTSIEKRHEKILNSYKRYWI